VKEKDKTVLLGFSGGLDSTYVLWHLLKNTEYKVHAHYIEMQYTNDGIESDIIAPWRWEAESRSVEKINKYFHKNGYRPYQFTRGIYCAPIPTIDIEIILFMLAQVAMSLIGDIYIATGRVQEDDERWNDLGGHYPGAIARRIMNISIRNNLKVMPLFKENRVLPNVNPKTFCPAQNMNKSQIIKLIPKDLASLTWSCRAPNRNNGEFYECGRCHSCETRRAGYVGR